MNTDHQTRFDSLYEQYLRALKRHGKATKTIEAYGLAVRRLAQLHSNARGIRALIQIALRVAIPPAPPRTALSLLCIHCQQSMKIIGELPMTVPRPAT